MEEKLLLKGLDKCGVSVVIVCHNGRDRLKNTLVHLSMQTEVDFPWEIVLVDNNSTDGTGLIARRIWSDAGSVTALNIVHEPRPGTMYARKRGMLASRYRYILFCDDDNWLVQRYVKAAFDEISSDETVAAVGGMGILAFEDNAVPSWVARFEKSFATGPQGTGDGDTTKDKGCLYTAGTIVDKVWLERLYNDYRFSSIMKGRDGKSLMAGEDTELTYALRLIGGRLFYSSVLQFRHYMPPGRLQWSYLKKLNKNMGRSDLLLYPYTEFFRDGKTEQPIWKLVAVRLIILLRTGIVAALDAFRMGSPAVLRFERAKGEIIAILFNLGQLKRSRAWIRAATEDMEEARRV